MTDAADPDNDPQVTVYVKSGQAAELFYHKANRTHLDHFKGYRVFKDNTSFAYMNNGSQTGNCSNSQLADFCSKKVEFRVYNATDLRLKINETSVNDSGCYAVEYRYEGLLSDHKHVIRLNVTLIVKEGKMRQSPISQSQSRQLETPAHSLLQNNVANYHVITKYNKIYNFKLMSSSEYTLSKSVVSKPKHL